MMVNLKSCKTLRNFVFYFHECILALKEHFAVYFIQEFDPENVSKSKEQAKVRKVP